MAGDRRLVYISGPLTNGGEIEDRKQIDFNIGRGCEIAYALNQRGHAFYLPHLTMYFEQATGNQLSFDDWLEIDLSIVAVSDCLFRIGGESKGADMEEAAAKEAGIPVFYDIRALDVWANAPALDDTQAIPVLTETVLEEALRITTADRNQQYGPPEEHMARTAAMWSAFLGVDISPSQVARAMVLDKIARSAHAPKRDHYVDMAGWAAVGQRAESGNW